MAYILIYNIVKSRAWVCEEKRKSCLLSKSNIYHSPPLYRDNLLTI